MLAIRSLLIVFLSCILLNVEFALAQNPPVDTECPKSLLPKPLQDPFSVDEMNEARLLARHIQTGLEDWGYRLESLNTEKVISSLAKMKANGIAINSPAFRNLFLIMQRFVLASKGADGRLRPLADLMEVREAEVRRLVNFFAQLDVMAMNNKLGPYGPLFMRLSSSPKNFFESELPHLPRSVRAFLEGPMARVLGPRIRYTRFKINDLGNQLTIMSPVGVYKLDLYEWSVERRSIAPILVGVTDQWGRQNDQVIHAKVEISINDSEASLFLRTMFRADAFLHPHLIPPSLDLYPMPARASEIQIEARDRLLKLDSELRKSAEEKMDHSPIVLGLTQPTGEGKTVTAAEYLKAMSEKVWNHQRPKIILVVENIQILEQTVESFQRDMGLEPQKIAMFFGDQGMVTLGSGAGKFVVRRGTGISTPTDFDLIVVTRSTFMARQSSFNLQIEKEQAKPIERRRPFAVIIDEAHHVGTEDGEFQDILSYFKERLEHRDRILYLSATMWHPERNIIRDDLKGAITGTHLMEDELRQLQAGENLEVLARTQFLRAQVEGYIGPIEDRSYTLYEANEHGRQIRERLRSPNVADSALYEYVSNLIRQTRANGIRDRYLFFEVRQERAEDGAKFIQNVLGHTPTPETDLHRASWFMHSSMPPEDQRLRMDWFRDRGDFRGSRNMHKYLTTVGQFLEGVDIRGVNGIVIMRNLSSFRLAQQVIGRGARLEPFKTGVRLIDVPGKIVGYLEEAGHLWDEVKYLGPQSIDGWNETPEKPLWLPKEIAAHAKEGAQNSNSNSNMVIDSRQVDLEPVLKRERQQIVAWREVPEYEMSEFTSPGGALELLGWDMLNGRRTSRVKLKTWFDNWFSRFTKEQQFLWRDQVASLGLTDTELEISNMPETDKMAAAQAFHLLAKMFNGLNLMDRYGLETLMDSERLLTSGQARVFARLDPQFNPTYLNGIQAAKDALLVWKDMTSEEAHEMHENLTSGILLAGPKPNGFMNSVTKSGRKSSKEILFNVRSVILMRPLLQTNEALSILKAADNAMVGSVTDEQLNIASYYLGLLMNHYIVEANLTSLHSWNLNGFYGLVAGEDFLADGLVSQPREFDIWELLDLAEHRLAQDATP